MIENSLEDQWKKILEHIRNSTAYWLYANGSSGDPLSTPDSGIEAIGIVFKLPEI